MEGERPPENVSCVPRAVCLEFEGAGVSAGQRL
jgi:hypothetical protein